MDWKPLTSLVLLLGLTQYCVDVAHAQSPPPRHLTVHKIEIVIGKDNCKEPLDVSIVINDVDRFKYPVTKVENRWTADTGSWTFDASSAHASLRVNGMRTDCLRSRPDFDQEIARFTFPQCPRESVQTITIFTVPGMDISYVRYFSPGQRGSVPCRERAAFESAKPRSVTSLQFPDEILVLQLDRPQPDPDAPGLRVNDLIDLYRSTGKSNFTLLTPGGIAYAVAVQRVKGIGSTPNLSSNAIDLQLRKLHDAKLEKLALRVE